MNGQVEDMVELDVIILHATFQLDGPILLRYLARLHLVTGGRCALYNGVESVYTNTHSTTEL
jgi:hypothetical protein